MIIKIYFKLKDPLYYRETSTIKFFREWKNIMSSFFYLLIPYISDNNGLNMVSSILSGGSISLHAYGSQFSVDLDRLGMFVFITAITLKIYNLYFQKCMIILSILFIIYNVLYNIKIFMPVSRIWFRYDWNLFLPWLLAYRILSTINYHKNNVILALTVMTIRFITQYNYSIYSTLLQFILDISIYVFKLGKYCKAVSSTDTHIGLFFLITGLFCQEEVFKINEDIHFLWHIFSAFGLAFFSKFSTVDRGTQIRSYLPNTLVLRHIVNSIGWKSMYGATKPQTYQFAYGRFSSLKQHTQLAYIVGYILAVIATARALGGHEYRYIGNASDVHPSIYKNMVESS